MEDDDFDAVEALETELRQAREATGEKTAEEAPVAPSEKSGAGMLAEVDALAAGGGASGDASASLSSSAEAGDTKPPTQSKPASTWEPKGTRGLSLAAKAKLAAKEKASRQALSQETRYDQNELYRKVMPVNTSECLEKVTQLPLKVFEFKYDSVQKRRQLGVIGRELESVLPEAVEVVKSQAFKNPDADGPPLVKLTNFPVVDKSVLFMYNVGATQELIQRSAALDAALDELDELASKQREILTELEDRINADVRCDLSYTDESGD